MQSEIGRGISGSALRASLAVGVLAVVCDFALIRFAGYTERVDGRWAVALVAFAAQVHFAGGDLAKVGVARPIGGWRRWMRLAIWMGVLVLACLAVAAQMCLAAGRALPRPTIPPEYAAQALFQMCVFVPLMEETIYRVALCVPLSAAIGVRGTVIVSGVSFALLHVAYSNPSPENLIGGFILAWAYLRSGSIAVPLALHAGGNLFAWAVQVAGWYWML